VIRASRGSTLDAGSAVDWGRTAGFYDWQLALERPALGRAVDLLAPQREDTLLDIGTGTGAFLRELARRPGRPSTAIGVDSSSAMLSQAPSLPEGWTLVQSDARRLPFEDGRFTAVTAAYLLHVVDPAARQEVIVECRRVLRAGGRFVVVTPAWPRTRLGRMLYAPLAAAAERASGPARGLGPLDPRALLEQAGFTITAAAHVARGYPSLCVAAALDRPLATAMAAPTSCQHRPRVGG